MAYRLFARNQSISPQMALAVQGKRPDGAPQCPTPPSSPFQPPGPGQPPNVSIFMNNINIINWSCQRAID